MMEDWRMTTNQTVLSVVDYNIKNMHLLSWAERFQCGKSSRVLRAPLLRLCNEKSIATCWELYYWLCAKRYCLLSELTKAGKYSLTVTLLGINNSNLLTVKFSQVGPFSLVVGFFSRIVATDFPMFQHWRQACRLGVGWGEGWKGCDGCVSCHSCL